MIKDVDISIWKAFMVIGPDAKAESVVESIWKVWSSNPNWVRQMIYNIDASRYLAWCTSVLWVVFWLAQYDDNVTQ